MAVLYHIFNFLVAIIELKRVNSNYIPLTSNIPALDHVILKPHLDPTCPITILNASFETNYSGSVQFGQRYNLMFFDFLKLDALETVMITTNANLKYPLLCNIEEQTRAQSWPIPFKLNDFYEYSYINNTLCPNLANETASHVVVDISTMSSTPVDFRVFLTKKNRRELYINESYEVTVGPAIFRFFLFVFPPNVSSVTVKAESSDSLCLLFSAQDSKNCPLDSLNNYDQDSFLAHQTVTTKGAITVTNKVPSFYIVFVVPSDDESCFDSTSVNKSFKNSGEHLAEINRLKSVRISIEASISDAAFTKIVLLTALIFIVIGSAFVLISAFYYRHIFQPRDDGVNDITDNLFEREQDEQSISINTQADSETLHKKHRTYWCTLLTVLIFYGLPVIQLVLTCQTVFNTFGTQDSCYYNFYCAHRWWIFASFNSIFSNIGYIILGFSFLCIVKLKSYCHGKKIKCEPNRRGKYGVSQHYGLFYAIAMALIMEGVLSACYHVCPNNNNFQFDTTFMITTACLCMLALYQNRHADIVPEAHVTFLVLALVTLLVLLGIVIKVPGFWWIYLAIHTFGFMYISLHVYYKSQFKFVTVWHDIKNLHNSFQQVNARKILLVIANLANVALAIVGVVITPLDFATQIVAIFILNLVLYEGYYIIIKCWNACCLGKREENIPFISIVLILVSVFAWIPAFIYFFHSPTNSETTPALSREKNLDCLCFGFYDNHDVWHFLSSLGLFLSFMVILTIDDNLINTSWNVIQVF